MPGLTRIAAMLRVALLGFLPTFGLALALLPPQAPATAAAISAAALPSNFQESIVFSGLTNPTAVRFAPDGRVFVAQKNGVIKVFSSLTLMGARGHQPPKVAF